MFVLWMFGCEVERYLGSKTFLKFYLMTGIGAGMFLTLLNWNSPVPVIGASGAIYGILVAFAITFPNRVVTLLLFFILPVSIKAKYLVAGIVGLSLLGGIQGQIFGIHDRVAHLAHLGGAVVGYLLLQWNTLIDSAVRQIAEQQNKKRMVVQQKQQDDILDKKQELDRILDKINNVGFDNITNKEKQFLKHAKDFLPKEDF